MNAHKTFRQHIYETLEAGRVETPMGRFADLMLITLIALNVLAVILESVASLGQRYGNAFDMFEVFSVSIFTVEYIARVWSAPEHVGLKFHHPLWGRLRYMLTPMALLDLIVIAPFFLVFFVGLDLRILRVLRLFRIFRLTRYSSSMGLLLSVLKEEAGNIGAALFVLAMLIVLSASITYLAEHEVQPVAFGSIPAALWWAVITMTTIGYGDVVPMTLVGKTCGALIGIVSVGMVALPAGILASGFNEALHRRRQRFEAHVESTLSDGVIDDAERLSLRYAQEDLGLSDTEAASIMRSTHHRANVRLGYCPHCGKPIRGSKEGRMEEDDPHDHD